METTRRSLLRLPAALAAAPAIAAAGELRGPSTWTTKEVLDGTARLRTGDEIVETLEFMGRIATCRVLDDGTIEETGDEEEIRSEYVIRYRVGEPIPGIDGGYRLERLRDLDEEIAEYWTPGEGYACEVADA